MRRIQFMVSILFALTCSLTAFGDIALLSSSNANAFVLFSEGPTVHVKACEQHPPSSSYRDCAGSYRHELSKDLVTFIDALPYASGDHTRDETGLDSAETILADAIDRGAPQSLIDRLQVEVANLKKVIEIRKSLSSGENNLLTYDFEVMYGKLVVALSGNKVLTDEDILNDENLSGSLPVRMKQLWNRSEPVSIDVLPNIEMRRGIIYNYFTQRVGQQSLASYSINGSLHIDTGPSNFEDGTLVPEETIRDLYRYDVKHGTWSGERRYGIYKYYPASNESTGVWWAQRNQRRDNSSIYCDNWHQLRKAQLSSGLSVFLVAHTTSGTDCNDSGWPSDNPKAIYAFPYSPL